MSTFCPTSPGVAHSTQQIAAFVDQLICQFVERGLYYSGPDRRREARHRIAVLVRTTPVDENLQPIGEELIVTTRDISSGGISLIHQERIEAPYLAVELTDLNGTPLRAMVEVLRRRPLGPFFEIAGRFVVKTYAPMTRDGVRRSSDSGSGST
jgi:hypothetical protein